MATDATDLATHACRIGAKQLMALAMPLSLEHLPDDLDALKALVVTKDTALETRDAELVAAQAELTSAQSALEAAKNGLLVTQLTIEHLKAQLAKLRRQRFGASSERIEREIAQLELKLEEAEAATAEATAPVAAEPEPAPVTLSPDAQPEAAPEAAQSEQAGPAKKRRTLPPELPRRDVVHAPADVCKTCGGHELRKVGCAVSEVLEYIPGRFEVVRHVARRAVAPSARP